MASAAAPVAGRVYIPAINLDEAIYNIAPVVDNAYDEFDRYVIGEGVQWLNNSAWIDTSGRVILAGHTPGVFDGLTLVEKGDQVMIYDDHDIIVYKVTGVFIAKPSEIEWLRESSEAKLLIITCDGENRLLIEGKPYGTR